MICPYCEQEDCQSELCLDMAYDDWLAGKSLPEYIVGRIEQAIQVLAEGE